MFESISNSILFSPVSEPYQACEPTLKFWAIDTFFLLVAQVSLMEPVFGEARNTVGTIMMVAIQLISVPAVMTCYCF